MQIDALDTGCVRIRLSPQEANEWQLEHGRMDGDDPSVRRFLRRMLLEAAEKTGLPLHNGRLLAQAYTARDGSVTLFFSVLDDPAQIHDDPLTVRFACADDMLSAMLGLFTLHCHRVLDSALYRMNGRFYAVIHPLSDSSALMDFLSEYGAISVRGRASLAFLDEHAERILPDNAMDVVAYYFT